MNEETKKYYSNLFLHKNHLPHAPQTEHIKKREVINKHQQYKKTVNGLTYTNTLPLIKITPGKCPECNCHTYSYDRWRGEKVCPQCGLVLEEGISQSSHNREAYHKPDKTWTWEEKRFLKKYGNYPYTTPTREWLNNIDNKTIQSLCCQAQLNHKQKIETKYIIDNIGFKKLHGSATKPVIISAVIRYVLKRTCKKPSLLRYNQGIFKDLLTKEVYKVVEKNIIKRINN